MDFRIFTATHQSGNETDIFTQESEERQMWILSDLPFDRPEQKSLLLHGLEKISTQYLLEMPKGESEEDVFENALKHLNEYLQNKLNQESAENLLRMGGLLIGYLSGSNLYISSFGQGEVFLWRKSGLMEISEGLSPTKTGGEFFANISSGDLQNDDKILFSTIRLQRSMSEKQMSHLLKDGVTEAIENIQFALDAEETGSILLLNIKSPPSFAFSEEKKKTGDFSQKGNDVLLQMQNTLENLWKEISQKGKTQKNSLLLGLAGIVGIILLVIFFQALSGQKETKETEQYTEFVNAIDIKLSSVGTRFTEGKIDQANEILNSMEKTALEMIENRVDETNAILILKEVQKKREDINSIMRIGNPDVMADLTTVKPDISAQGLFFLNNELLTFDEDSLYRVLLSGSGVENLGSITSGDSILLGTDFRTKKRGVFLTKGGSVLEWKDGQTITADTADSVWKPATDIKTYSKFLYFLDPSANQIWKYERRDSTYTLAEGWVGEEVDLSTAVSITVDGSIFVLDSKGTIRKLHRGKEVEYTIKGSPSETIVGDHIYTTGNLGRLFVLDGEGRRVIVLSKGENEAHYEKQLVFEGTGPLLDIFATENQIFVLDAQKIYRVAL